jgi:rubredoxin-NAD+ reductase
MDTPLVIVGTGLAGWTLAREFRKLDPHTPIVLISRDEGAFYSKPMLSNALAGGRSPASLVTTPATAAAEAIQATVLAQREVVRIDTVARSVVLDDRVVPYRALVLAVGAEPIRLPLQGDASDRVFSVNDLVDYGRFHAALNTGAHVTLLGAGLIGCEFANDLVIAGHSVDVVDLAPLPLGRLVPERAGQAMQVALSTAGVGFQLGASVRAVHRDGARLVVELVVGGSMQAGSMQAEPAEVRRLSTDLVLSAVGLQPRTILAAAAGLTVDRGIVVDSMLRTNTLDIYALGDCAQVDGQVLPYVLPLMTGARALAKTLTGMPTAVAYPVMPVAVKTPALPLSVVPAPQGIDGGWSYLETEGGLEGHFKDREGRLQGFVLGGAATARRAALVRAMGQAVSN